MAANGTGSLVFIDDVTADRSSKMNSEVSRALLSAHIQPNATKLIGRRFTVQVDNDPKHTAKATQDFLKAKKWNILQWPKSNPACLKAANLATRAAAVAAARTGASHLTICTNRTGCREVDKEDGEVMSAISTGVGGAEF
ncbi:hypothetical protein PDJAM_G00046810 [Pangasius djambal]|uniref:Uncharacterized protein n=1 Tax=Pangasius djambal TaxID=1691987 RepID=A0ACC5YUX8_9TELE|nr:hypothetical protein [Pangasius djambal]